MNINVIFLADRPDLIPVLSEWFAGVWAPYYGPMGPGDAKQDLRACAQKKALPVGLVALGGAGIPVGTASLKAVSVAERSGLGPWLAALVVRPEKAGEGVANVLVEAIEEHARRRGDGAIYCDANTSDTKNNPGGWEEADAGLLVNRGWKSVGAGNSLRGVTGIYEFSIAPKGASK